MRPRLVGRAVACLLDAGRGFFTYQPTPGWSWHPGGNNNYDQRHLGRVNMLFVDGHVGDRDFYWFWNDAWSSAPTDTLDAWRALHWPEVLAK